MDTLPPKRNVRVLETMVGLWRPLGCLTPAVTDLGKAFLKGSGSSASVWGKCKPSSPRFPPLIALVRVMGSVDRDQNHDKGFPFSLKDIES